MKKITILMTCFLFAYMAKAQTQGKEYDHWSIEVNAGPNKASRPFTPGYYNSTLTFENGNWSGDAGVRYMINNLFGFKASFGYSKLKEAGKSDPFESKYYRYDLEGVVNMGSLLGFREWTQRFNFLVHGGAGFSQLKTGDNALYSNQTDNMTNFMVGVTPQVRLTNWLALNLDLTIIGNEGHQGLTWDGNQNVTTRGFNGMLINASAGLSFYLGGAEKHADWVDVHSLRGNEIVDSLRNRISEIENKMQDDDQDGVANYLDREPNTMNGVAVNAKGVAVDKNKNGIPDEIESGLKENYVTREEYNNTSKSGTIKELIDKGYVNVYFKFNSKVPETYSYNAINYLILYMKENPSSSADLVGYADELGSDSYNQKLSKERAKAVYNILTAAGIDESRLSFEGKGSDTSVDKGSKPARQIVRRVTFRLN